MTMFTELISLPGNANPLKKTDDLMATRATLLKRLKNWQDNESWQDFFNLYWRLLYNVARKAGLSDQEAQDVVQETLVSVAKHIPTFEYDPSLGSFKTWLLNMTRWRVIAAFRKRRPLEEPAARANSTARTDPIEALPDMNALDLDKMWEAEWQTNLLAAAMENLRHKLDPQKLQIFDFYVQKGWPPEKVAKQFGVSVDLVYQIKHRVTESLRDEVSRLEKQISKT